jgi:membrane-associated phospholipid phosphatase
MSGSAPAARPNKPPSNRFALKLARTISWVGHPLVFVSISLGIIVAKQLANRTGIAVLLALILAVVLPTAVLLIRGVRSGRWSDADVSVRTERVRFYPPAILLSLGGMVALFVLHAPGFMLRGAGVTLGMLLLAAVLNRFVKVSLHGMFAFYCATVLLAIGWPAGLSASLLALLVVWSRFYLRRHGIVEIVLGSAIGIIGGILSAWWP